MAALVGKEGEEVWTRNKVISPLFLDGSFIYVWILVLASFCLLACFPAQLLVLDFLRALLFCWSWTSPNPLLVFPSFLSIPFVAVSDQFAATHTHKHMSLIDRYAPLFLLQFDLDLFLLFPLGLFVLLSGKS